MIFVAASACSLIPSAVSVPMTGDIEMGTATDPTFNQAISPAPAPLPPTRRNYYIAPFSYKKADPFNLETSDMNPDRLSGSLTVSTRSSRKSLLKNFLVAYGFAFAAGVVLMFVVTLMGLVSRMNAPKVLTIAGVAIGGAVLLIPLLLQPFLPTRTGFRYENDRKETVSNWYQCSPVMHWLIDLRDEAGRELHRLLLRLPDDPTVQWSVAFRDENDPFCHSTSYTDEYHGTMCTDHFQPISYASSLAKIANGRRVFVLKAYSEKGFSNFWKRHQNLFQLEFETDARC